MALEPITRQEQIIAGKDLEPITRMEKFLKEYGGGGGASSWNDLDDRPFGEVTTYGDTLTWDGNTEGLYCVNDMAYLISDAAPTLADFANGGSLATTESGVQLEVREFTSSDVEDTGANILNVMGFGFLIVLQDGASFSGLTFDKKGTYVVYDPSSYAHHLQINGYNGFPATTVKPIDNKYLEPFETVGGDTLTWDGNTEGRAFIDMDGSGYACAYHLSDAIPTADDLTTTMSATMQSIGTSDTITCTNVEVVDMGYGLLALLNTESDTLFAFIIPTSAVGVDIDGLVFSRAGFYAVRMSFGGTGFYMSSLTINGYTGFTTTKLKEEYLPDGGGKFVVNFSTADMQTWTCDKTYNDIKNAYEKGKDLLGVIAMGDVCMYMEFGSYTAADQLLFRGYSFMKGSGVNFMFIFIDPDNSISLEMHNA